MAPNFADLVRAAVDMEEVAEREHGAGFEVIPLGGVRLLQKSFDKAEDAAAYVDACVTPLDGELVGRRALADGRVEVRVCVPALGAKADRSKMPDVPKWQELPWEPSWWRDRTVVPLPPGWTNWGKAKAGGKAIKERRGSCERNVGIRTGTAAGLAVIDVDRKDGRDGLAALGEKFGEDVGKLFPETFTVRTPTGGEHWYYECDAPVSNSASLLAPGVDVRGEGGYVVGPGSMRMNGGRYEVVRSVPPARLPDRTVELLMSLRPGGRDRAAARGGRLTAVTKDEALERILERFPEVASGQRHDVLVRAAGVARNLVEDDADLEWVIRTFADRRGVARREPEDLDRIVEDARSWERRPSDGAKRVIVVDLDEARAVRELEEAMASAPGLYQRGQQLTTVVEPKKGSKAKHPAIAPVARAVLRTWSTELVDWITLSVEEGQDGGEDQVVETPIRPPGWAISAFHAQRRWPNVSWLEGVVDYPVLLPGGAALSAPGYDPDSGLYLAGDAVPLAVPERPTQGDARAALAELAEIFCDFPFADDFGKAGEGDEDEPSNGAPTAGEAYEPPAGEREDPRGPSRSAAVAAVLTPLARHAFHGPVPLFAIDKAARGTGGSLMADCVGVLLTGRPMPRMIHASSDEEQRKVITSLMIEGAPLVLLDNVAGPLGTPALDALLTGTTWKDRLLGANEMVVLPNNATIFATGNNVVFQGDTSRRTLRVRLESALENPEDRSDFRHPDLLAWIRRERPRLLSAALTLLRAYVLAGQPPQELRPWGSFEDWSALVRGCLVWAGWPDPADARATSDEELDGDKQTLVELIVGLEEMAAPGEKLTAREIFRRLRQSAPMTPTDVDPYPGLRAVLSSESGKLLAPRLISSGFLRKHKGRVWDGRTIASEHNRTKTSEWFVRRLRPAAGDGTSASAQDCAPEAPGDGAGSAGEAGGNGAPGVRIVAQYTELFE